MASIIVNYLKVQRFSLFFWLKYYLFFNILASQKQCLKNSFCKISNNFQLGVTKFGTKCIIIFTNSNFIFNTFELK